jgi:hypothetical protein
MRRTPQERLVPIKVKASFTDNSCVCIAHLLDMYETFPFMSRPDLRTSEGDAEKENA